MTCKNCKNCNCTNERKLNLILLNHTPEPEKLIASAAKLCYSKSDISDLYNNQTPDKVESFINKLLTIHHESPLEHISFTFGIEGVSRSLTHQLVRHRLASYSQKSQRYVSENQFKYIIPNQIQENKNTDKIYNDLMIDIQDKYNQIFNILMVEKIKNFIIEKPNDLINQLISYIDILNYSENDYLMVLSEFKDLYKETYSKFEKCVIEDVRYILPNATETKIIVTMNFRTLMNFCRERTCNRAQWEIRNMAIEMIKLIKPICPILYKLLCPNCVNEKCNEGYMSCGKINEVKEFFNNL